MNWNFYLNFLAAMLAIVNPIGIWPIWSELTNDEASKIRKRVAIMVIFTAYFILVIFLIGGKYLLQFFSIDLQVFKVAGGILLLYVGISMVRGSATQVRKSHIEGETTKALAKQRFREIIVPMGIPALAGPGSITTVIVFGNQAQSAIDYLFLSIVILIAFLALLLVFLSSSYLEKNVDDIVFTIFTRTFGIIVTAIAIQFIVEGLGEIFPVLIQGSSVLDEKSIESITQ